MQHPFERTLGPGPYKFVGMFYINKTAGAQGLPYYDKMLVHPNFKAGAGTCSHCGQAILNVCQVKVASGDVFGVGIDCVQKVSLPYSEMSQIEKARKAHEKKLRLARAELKRQAYYGELKELFDLKKDEMSALPHPNSFFASQGKTLADYAEYFISRPQSNCKESVFQVKNSLGKKS